MLPNAIRTDFTYQYPPFNVLDPHDASAIDTVAPVHVYVHIPFCKTKCKYCYYKTWGVGEQADNLDRYLDLLKREIRTYGARADVQSRHVRSLYVGGGTPSLFSAAQLEGLVTALKDGFPFAEDFEFCMEANPDEVVLSDEKLSAMRRLGVTRLSMGVQSLNDDLLRQNGRSGSAAVVRRVYRRAREIGFPVINLDFLCGLLGERWDNWRAQVDGMLELAPDSVSIYKLEFYMNTQLTRQLSSLGDVDLLIDDNEEARMAQYAFDRLRGEAGYRPVSCFSLIRRPEAEHTHMRGVWGGEPLIGLGLSAYGTFNGYFYQNAWSLEEYGSMVTRGLRPVVRAHRVTAREQVAATMIYGVKSLRLDRRRFLDRHGFDMRLLYGDVIDELIRDGHLLADADGYEVPRSRAIFADDICRAFFLPEHRGMMRAHVPRRAEQTSVDPARPFAGQLLAMQPR